MYSETKSSNQSKNEDFCDVDTRLTSEETGSQSIVSTNIKIPPSLLGRKKKRNRRYINRDKITILEEIFAEKRSPNAKECSKIAKENHLKRKLVMRWFKNKRRESRAKLN